MADVIVLVDNELDEIINAVNTCQLFFNPKYCNEGMFCSKDLIEVFPNKEKVVILDRNIMTLLIKYVTEGILENEEQMTEIALIMFWCSLQHINITSGMALNEYANFNNTEACLKNELDIFLTVTEKYSAMLWKRVLFSTDKTIPKINKVLEYNRDIDFDFKNDHQVMHECEMIKLTLINKNNKSNKEKLIEFMNWYFDNLIICNYTLVYVILLFGNYEGIKLPKNNNSIKLQKVIKGCENQAWDLSYISNWSTMYWEEEKKHKIHFFSTMDNLLKTIIIVTHSGYPLNHIIEDLFPKTDALEINTFINDRIDNRIKPKMSRNYLEKLLKKLKKELFDTLED